MSNIVYSPSYPTKYTRTTGKTFSIGRFEDPSAGYAGGLNEVVAARPGHVYLVDKIHVRGQTVAAATSERAIMVIKDAAGATVTTLTFMGLNGSGAAVLTTLDWEIPVNGRLVIPENYTVVASASEPAGANAPVVSGLTITLFGSYEPVLTAARQGLYFGDTTASGNYFIAGAVPANTTATELVAARAGKAIRVLGWCASGQISTTTATFLISHYDGTTDRGMYKWYFNSTNPANPLKEFAHEDYEIPIGESVRYTASANAVNRVAFWMWGTYTDSPSTINPDGFHSNQGVASAGGASTLTDDDYKWTTNQFANRRVMLVEGTGAGQYATIASNNANQLTITGTWPTVNPDATTVYYITIDGDSGSGGTVSYTATTLVDTGKSWKTNQWAGRLVRSGSSTATVESNSATTLTLLGAGWAGGTPAGAAAYTISPSERETGSKFWTFIDNSNADATATVYRVMHDRVTRYAVVRAMQVSIDPNSADVLRPFALQLVAAPTARKGSGIANNSPVDLFVGLNALGAGSLATSCYLARGTTSDYHSVVSEVDVPILVGTDQVAQIDVAHGADGFSTHISGRLRPNIPAGSATSAQLRFLP